MYPLLDTIHSPEDLRRLSDPETIKLADGSTMIGEKPSKKSKYSHIADGLQYGSLGSTGGGGAAFGMPSQGFGGVGGFGGFQQSSQDAYQLVGGCDFGCA